MAFLNFWILFSLVPLYFIYKRVHIPNRQTKILYLSLLFIFIALARPVLQNTLAPKTFHSQDFIIALDASYSMQATDLKPSRYILAKEAIKKLINLHPKDKFTLFIFTSKTLLISPPTTDKSISMQALNAINPDYILTKSTNLENLFEVIAKSTLKKKNLIIFTDGGEEHSDSKLSKILERNNIIPYIVATATHKGAALKKDGKYIHTKTAGLVISKLNPMLIDLADTANGKYYELNSLSPIDKLSKDLSQQSAMKKESILVNTYTELFYYPLILALILFFASVTKLHQLLLGVMLLFFYPNQSHAGVLDFYYLHNATKDYNAKYYLKSAQAFTKITPSVTSYYNTATAYYKAGHYKQALEFYTQIRTTNPHIKQYLLYNIANCAFKLKKYNKAKELYIQALSFSEDRDALHNLNLLKKYHLVSDKDVSKQLPHKQKQAERKKEKGKKTSSKKQKNASGNSNTQQKSQQTTNGQGSEKKKGKKKRGTPSKTKHKSDYKISYKAYEKINKGYINEKEPW